MNQISSGASVQITFGNNPANVPNPLGGLVSSFSSYGPSYDMMFKPAVAAPGGNIISTYLLSKGGFMVLSGTSMATPFTAGTAALILQATNKSSAAIQGMRDLLQTTANPVPSNITEGAPWQTLSWQGMGLIQADAAINARTWVSPAQLLLNDTANFNGT